MKKNIIAKVTALICICVGYYLNSVYKIVSFKIFTTKYYFFNRVFEAITLGFILICLLALCVLIFGSLRLWCIKSKLDKLDQKSLLHLAKNEKDWVTRMKALERLETAESLANVIRNAYYDDARIAAKKKLIELDMLFEVDERTLQYLAKHDFERSVRLGAVNKLENPDSLEDVFRSPNYDDVKNAAKEKLKRLGRQ